jgi:hypothetical protein
MASATEPSSVHNIIMSGLHVLLLASWIFAPWASSYGILPSGTETCSRRYSSDDIDVSDLYLLQTNLHVHNSRTGAVLSKGHRRHMREGISKEAAAEESIDRITSSHSIW